MARRRPTCVGKVTYLRASYWHQELSMLDTAGKEYSYANALDLFGGGGRNTRM